MTELRTTASNATFDDTIAQLGAQNPQQAIEVLDRRQDLNEQSDRYFAAPIIGVFDSDFPSEPGDRYIDSADPTVIKVVGGIDEPFPDGAIAAITGTNQICSRVGQNIEITDLEALRSRVDSLSFAPNPHPYFEVYVDAVNGSDLNDGLSVENSFLTLEKALASFFDDSRSCFSELSIELQSDLTFSEPLNIRDFQNRTLTIASPFRRRKTITFSSSAGLNIVNCKNVVLSDLDFTGGNSGILVSQSLAKITGCSYSSTATIPNALTCQDNSQVFVSDLSLNSNFSTSAIRIRDNSEVIISNQIVTVENLQSPSFIDLRRNSSLLFLDSGLLNSRTIVGKRFSLSESSRIQTSAGTADPTFIQATLPGEGQAGCVFDFRLFDGNNQIDGKNEALRSRVDSIPQVSPMLLLYLSESGVDSNDGLSLENPVRSLERVKQIINLEYQASNVALTILGDYLFSETLVIDSSWNCQVLSISGNVLRWSESGSGDLIRVINDLNNVSDYFEPRATAPLTFLEGVTIEPPATGNRTSLRVRDGATVVINQVKFRASNLFHIFALGSQVYCYESSEFQGGAQKGIYLINSKLFLFDDIDFFQSQSYSRELLHVSNSTVQVFATRFANALPDTVVGKKYTIEAGSRLDFSPANPDYNSLELLIPGDTPGTIAENCILNGELLKTRSQLDQLASRDRITKRFTGLVPAINTDSTKWQVGVGRGQLADSYTNPEAPIVRLVENTAVRVYSIPTLLNGAITSCYAYYYWDGAAIAVGYQEAAPVADDLVDKLFLCEIISSNGTTIDSVRPISLADEPETKTLLTFGAVNVEQKYPQPIAGTMGLSFGGGKFKFAGRNAYNNPKQPHTVTIGSIATISYSLCDPLGNILATETEFDFNRFWDGNAIAPLTNPDFASLQFVYLFPSGAIAVVLGQNEYTSLSLATGQGKYYESFLPDKFKNNSYFWGTIAGLGNATNMANKQEVLDLWL